MLFDAFELLEKLVGFLDESQITVADDPTELYADGKSLQEFGKNLCANDFKSVVRQAKDLVAKVRLRKCRDCGQICGQSMRAIYSFRCDGCQKSRDEYYAEKLRMEHPIRRSDAGRAFTPQGDYDYEG